MWYENNEDDLPKSQAKPEAEEGQGTTEYAHHPHKTVGTQDRMFGASDPTKAFEDDAAGLGSGAPSAGEMTALKAAIKELDDKANANYDRYLRALAELENYKKRVTKERMEQLRFAGEDLLREILPVVDNLERTLAHSHELSDVNKVLEGVTMIQRQFQKVLEKAGITLIDQAGKPFDPSIHQALERVVDNTHPDDTVLQVLQKGYILNGKVIRPAMVKVAKHH